MDFLGEVFGVQRRLNEEQAMQQAILNRLLQAEEFGSNLGGGAYAALASQRPLPPPGDLVINFPEQKSSIPQMLQNVTYGASQPRQETYTWTSAGPVWGGGGWSDPGAIRAGGNATASGIPIRWPGNMGNVGVASGPMPGTPLGGGGGGGVPAGFGIPGMSGPLSGGFVPGFGTGFGFGR